MTTPETPQPADQTSLRDRIAAAVDEGFRLYAELEDTSLGDSIVNSVLTAMLAEPAASAVVSPPTSRAELRKLIMAAIKASPFEELRSVDYANGPLKITVMVDDLADTLLRRMADETTATQTALPAENPARIDRLRPEFTEHASVEAIDVQLQRARRQQGMWDRRVQTLTSLRQTRVTQKERGEWPAAAQPAGGEQ